MSRRHRHSMVGAAAMVLIAGCGSSTSRPAQTITLSQAEQRLKGDMSAIVATLPVKPRLDPVTGSDGMVSGACSKDLEDAPNGKFNASLHFFLRDVPSDRNPAIFDAVRDFAAKHGYRPHSTHQTFTSFTDKDGFGIELNENDAHTLSLGVSAPCVPPDHTPAPKSG